jgi:hypothetical protein
MQIRESIHNELNKGILIKMKQPKESTLLEEDDEPENEVEELPNLFAEGAR